MARRRAESTRPDWNSHVRGGWVILWIWQGAKLSERDIARLCGISRQMAAKMMVILEANFQIAKIDGVWQWIDKNS